MEESATSKIQEEANASVNGNSESQTEANSPRGNEIPNGRVDREANASVRNEHQDRALANDITQMIESWVPPSPRLCRIYRVPHDIRIGNEEAYTPTLISIGPFHHGDERLKPMEKLKVKYFKLLVEESALDVENSLRTIRSMERDIRRCYEEPSVLSSDDYVKMILMDASFSIVLSLKFVGPEKWKSLVSEDHLIASQCSISSLGHDMCVLENQLPFFVIEELYNLAFPSHSFSNYLPFKELAFKSFRDFHFQDFDSQDSDFQVMCYDPDWQIMHFVDFIRTIFLPTSLPDRGSSDESRVELLYSASQLHDAGVKFKAVSNKSLLDLKFTNGVLEIPSFEFFRYRVFLYRNLMALEQCCYLNATYFTDYIRVLNFLIDTVKDVDLLVQKGILVNRSSDSNEVTTWLNNLCAYHIDNGMPYHYYTLCGALNTFYERRLNRWKAILIRDYFDNPWRATATTAAIILLALTFIQTVRSFY